MNQQIIKTFHVEPIGKPRATQRDKWKPSLAVQRYHHFKDSLLAAVLEDRELRAFLRSTDVYRVDWIAWFPIPRSWTDQRKAELPDSMHRQKPDKDNVEKAILDALFKEDSAIAMGGGEKRWNDGQGARIQVTLTGYRKGGDQ